MANISYVPYTFFMVKQLEHVCSDLLKRKGKKLSIQCDSTDIKCFWEEISEEKNFLCDNFNLGFRINLGMTYFSFKLFISKYNEIYSLLLINVNLVSTFDI